jgi:hypothetical protein
MVSALLHCSWPRSALAFPTICVWHFQGLMLCTRLVGGGSIKSRWFAGHSFRLQVCMIFRYTVYVITSPLLRFLPAHVIHRTAICALFARLFGPTIVLDYYWYWHPAGAGRWCSQAKGLREQPDYRRRTLETSLLVRQTPPEGIISVRADMLRRVLVALDRSASSGLGRPCALQDEE